MEEQRFVVAFVDLSLLLQICRCFCRFVVACADLSLLLQICRCFCRFAIASYVFVFLIVVWLWNFLNYGLMVIVFKKKLGNFLCACKRPSIDRAEITSSVFYAKTQNITIIMLTYRKWSILLLF